MNLAISKCVTAVKVSNFPGHYLRNRSTLDIGVMGYIGIVQHKEHSPEVLSLPPGTLCIQVQLAICVLISGLRRTSRTVAVAQCLSTQICIQADSFIRRTDVPHRLSLVEEQ